MCKYGISVCPSVLSCSLIKLRRQVSRDTAFLHLLSESAKRETSWIYAAHERCSLSEARGGWKASVTPGPGAQVPGTACRRRKCCVDKKTNVQDYGCINSFLRVSNGSIAHLQPVYWSSVVAFLSTMRDYIILLLFNYQNHNEEGSETGYCSPLHARKKQNTWVNNYLQESAVFCS